MLSDFLGFFGVIFGALVILITGLGAPIAVLKVLSGLRDNSTDKAERIATAVMTLPYFIALVAAAMTAYWPDFGSPIGGGGLDHSIDAYLAFMGVFFILPLYPVIDLFNGYDAGTLPSIGLSLPIFAIWIAAVVALGWLLKAVGTAMVERGQASLYRLHQSRSSAIRANDPVFMGLRSAGALNERLKAAYPDLITDPRQPGFDQDALDAARAEFAERPDEKALLEQEYRDRAAAEARSTGLIQDSRRNATENLSTKIGAKIRAFGEVLYFPLKAMKITGRTVASALWTVGKLVVALWLVSAFLVSGAAALVHVLIPGAILLGTIVIMLAALFLMTGLWVIITGRYRRF
jgi:hypothetical protein